MRRSLYVLAVVFLILSVTELYKHDIEFLQTLSITCFLLAVLEMHGDWNVKVTFRNFFTAKGMQISPSGKLFEYAGIILSVAYYVLKW